MPNYFGVNLHGSKYGFNISRDYYAVVDNKSSIISNKVYTDDWCRKHLDKCLQNYDLNMKYFTSLDKDEFRNELNKFLKKNKKFVQIYDLNQCAYKKGYYMLVLDNFCQVYIGTSEDIKKRIMTHWSKRKLFDRLIFGSVSNSIISIDSFRAFDTTRIFAYMTSNIFSEENKIISKFPNKFSLNRTIGGMLEGGLLEAVVNGKTRELS